MYLGPPSQGMSKAWFMIQMCIFSSFSNFSRLFASIIGSGVQIFCMLGITVRLFSSEKEYFFLNLSFIFGFPFPDFLCHVRNVEPCVSRSSSYSRHFLVRFFLWIWLLLKDSFLWLNNRNFLSKIWIYGIDWWLLCWPFIQDDERKGLEKGCIFDVDIISWLVFLVL